MLKKVAALLLVSASMSAWLGCGSTSSRYLYAAIPASNQIVIYREDPNAGVLTQLAGSPVTAGQAVQSLVLHPSNKFLYAANSGSNNISLYAIGSDGSIAEITPRTNAGTSPTLLIMDSAGTYLYAANSGSFDISVYSIDQSNGALTPVPQLGGGTTAPIGVTPINMKLSPAGNLYVTGQGLQGFIEEFPVTAGVLEEPVDGSPFLTGNNPYGLAIDAGGSFLYTANKVDSTISEFAINADGSLTEFVGSPIGESFVAPANLLIDNSGKYLYVANQGSTNISAYSIGTDGTLTLLTSSPFGSAAQPLTMASDPSGKYLFVGNQSTPVIQSFSLDSSTGNLTSISSYSVPGTPTSIVVKP